MVLMAAVPAQTAPLQRVSVDIAVQGVGAIANHLRNALPGKLNRALAEHPIDGFPPSARMIVRVKTIFLSSDAPVGGFGASDDSSGFSSQDGMEGDVRILDAAGNVLMQKSMIAHSPAHMGGNAPSPLNEQRRVDALMNAFTYWTMREFR